MEYHLFHPLEFCSSHSLDHAHSTLHHFFLLLFCFVCSFLLFPIPDLNTLVGDSNIHRLRGCQRWAVGKSHFTHFPRIQLGTSPSCESHRNILPVSGRPKIWVLGTLPTSLQGTLCCQVPGIIQDRAILVAQGKAHITTTFLKSERHLPQEIQKYHLLPQFHQKLAQKQVGLWLSKTDYRLAHRDRQRQILWWLGSIAYTPMRPLLIKPSFTRQIVPPWGEPSVEESATNYELVIALNRLLRAKCGQHLTFAHTSLRQYHIPS